MLFKRYRIEQNKKEEIRLYAKGFEAKGFEYSTSDADRTQIVKALEKIGAFCSKGLYVLDFGCGTGVYTPYIARRRANVVGLDIVSTNVRIAKFRNNNICQYICADGCNSPFKNGSFDAVFVGQVLHHFPNPMMPLQEINRILKKGGRLFLLEPNSYNLIVRLRYIKFVRNYFGHSINERPFGYIFGRRILQDLGFEILSRKGFTFSLPRLKILKRFIQFIDNHSLLSLFSGSLLISAIKK
jgi:SAM-dependent methyltransferase